MLGYLINISNVNFNSNVLLVENTRGLMTGAVMEREPRYTLRVEFCHESLLINNEILAQFDFNSEPFTRLGSVHSKLLVPLLQEKPDPLLSAMTKQYKKKFNSFIFVHNELHPMEVWKALKSFIQPSGSFAIFSLHVQPLAEVLNFMHQEKNTVNAMIEELWTREQQVLPLRTHPHMSMHG